MGAKGAQRSTGTKGSHFDFSPHWGPQEGRGSVAMLISPHYGNPWAWGYGAVLMTLEWISVDFPSRALPSCPPTGVPVKLKLLVNPRDAGTAHA